MRIYTKVSFIAAMFVTSVTTLVHAQQVATDAKAGVYAPANYTVLAQTSDQKAAPRANQRVDPKADQRQVPGKGQVVGPVRPVQPDAPFDPSLEYLCRQKGKAWVWRNGQCVPNRAVIGTEHNVPTPQQPLQQR